MADKQKGKCPVCNVQVSCDEKIYVHATVDRCASASPNARGQEPETFLILAQDPPSRAQALNIEDGEETDHEEGKSMLGKSQEGLDDVDIDAFWYFVDLRARIDYIKNGLGLLQGSSGTWTPVRWNRLTRFFADTAQKSKGSKRRKIDVAMFSSGGTDFTMNDLTETLSSAEEWTEEDVAAVLAGRRVGYKDVVSLRKLEKKLTDV